MCHTYYLMHGGSTVRLLGRYQGRNGAIKIVECSADGTRIYFEEGVRQSQATPDGESVFSYVRLMDELLHRAANVLLLGCGGGDVATRLARLGKELTIVDNNPISFVRRRDLRRHPRAVDARRTYRH